MKLSIVLSTHAAKFEAATFKGDFESNVKRIADFGYDGVELSIRDPKLVDAGQLKSTVESAGLTVPAIGTGQAWGEEKLSFTDPAEAVREKAVERIKSHVPVAALFGGVIIIGLVRGVVQEDVDEARAREWMEECFRECTDEALQADVRIAFEPLNRYETTLLTTAREGLDFIEKVGNENLGLLLDTFHMNIEEPSIEESITMCGTRIFHFHVADSNRWYPGAGHIDFPSVLEALFSTGYKGFVSGEFMPNPDPATSSMKAIEYLRSLEKSL